MHERVIATEMKLDISIQIAVDRALVKKSEEIAEWTTQVANINEYVSINAAKPGNSSERMLIFFSIKNKFLSPMLQIQLHRDAYVQKFQSVLSALTMLK